MPSLQLPHPNIIQDSIFIPEVLTTPEHFSTKMDIYTEEEFFPKRLPFVKGEPTIQEKSSVRPESWKVSALDIWAKNNLRPCLQRQLADSTSKHSTDKTMEGKIVFRHVLPYVLLYSAFFTGTDMENLDQATPLPVMFLNLLRRYANIDTSTIRGYDMYKDFKKEVDYNQEGIILTSAALLQKGFNVQAMTGYIGGSHIEANIDLAKIRETLTPGVESHR